MHEKRRKLLLGSRYQGSVTNEVVDCSKFEPVRRQQHNSVRRRRDNMQTFLPLHLVTVGVGLAWLVRVAVNSPPKGKGAAKAGDVTTAQETTDADMERSATQWLARNVPGRSPSPPSPSEHSPARPSSYPDLELLAEGNFVYLRSGGSVLTALMPTVRHLTLQPLQLVKGKPDAIPTAPLGPISVWLVRRCKQQVIFELLGPHHQRHILEADCNAPHGVALGGGSPGKRGRWLITPHGLTSACWQAYVLPLQVVSVQLVDSRAVKSVRDSLGHKVTELGVKLRQEEYERTQVEVEKVRLEAELTRVRNGAASQVVQLRAQLDAAVIARHVAEREVAALHIQKAHEALRIKRMLEGLAQVEVEAQQAQATVRQQQQQIQGLLAGHAEELRALQQELQIARETNGDLKRAMREQILALQGALELRDATILELEEENDRMDTVLQVIQTQLGGGGLTLPPFPRGSNAGNRPPAEVERNGTAAGPPSTESLLDAAALGASRTSAGGGDEADRKLNLSAVVSACRSPPFKQEQEEARLLGPAALPPVTEEPPLWRSLWDLTGDLSVTALKESLAISRRNTVEEAPVPIQIVVDAQQPPQCRTAAQQAQDYSQDARKSHAGLPCSAMPPPSERRVSHVGSAASEARPATGNWGSGGGSESSGKDRSAAALEDVFVSAAFRMSETMELPHDGGAGDGSGGSAMGSPLRTQHPQLAGTAGVIMGISSAEQTHPAGASADTCAPRRNSGGNRDCASSARTPRTNGTLLIGSTGPGRNPSQLEYGMEATLTLDSLRRRMRQLEAERERLELLRVSLEESLPWRAGLGTAFRSSKSCAGVPTCFQQACGGSAVAMLAGGDGRVAALLGLEDSYELDQKHQPVQMEHTQQPAQQQHQDQLGRKPIGQDQQAHAWQTGAQKQQEQVQVHIWGSGSFVGSSTRDEQRQQRDHSSCYLHHDVKQQEQRRGTSPGCVRGDGAAGSCAAQPWRKTYSGVVSNNPVPCLRLPSTSLGGAGCRGTSCASPGTVTSPLSAARAHCNPEKSFSVCSINNRQMCDAPSVSPPNEAPTAQPRSSAVDAGSGPCSSGGVEGAAHGREFNYDSACSSYCSSDGNSGTSVISPRVKSSASCLDPAVSGEMCLVINPTAVATGTSMFATDSTTLMDGPTPDENVPSALLPSSEQTDVGSACNAHSGPAGQRPPGIITTADTPRAHGDFAYGLYHSIEGSMCNLGSTRALPTARGAGWQTARRVGHSRQPSASIPAVEVPLPSPDGVCRSPVRMDKVCHAAAETAVAGTSRNAGQGVGDATPNLSCAVTPKSIASAGDFGGDDDGLVHCDEQGLSPPTAMLLGPLDQLRGVAAAATATATGGVDGSPSRIGGQVLDEDDEY